MSKGTALVPTNTGAMLPARRDETRAEVFKRLANGRAGEAIDAMRRLGNLGTPAYDYTDAEVAKLERALREALTAAMTKLRARSRAPAAAKPIL